MKTYHVGGLNPIRRCATLTEALNKANHDDTIEIHKNITESVTINKAVIIDGKGHTLTVSQGKVGMRINAKVIMKNITLIGESRANALIIESTSDYENVKVLIKGPIREFYPTVYIKAGNPRFLDCVLMKVVSENDTLTYFDNCEIQSYYGGNIETENRSEASVFYGETIIKGGCIESTTFNGHVDMSQVIIKGLVQLHDGKLNSIIFDLQDTEPRVKLKKEPSIGPLSSITENKYGVYITGEVLIDGYNIQNTLDDYTGFYMSGANVSVKRLDCHDNKLTHRTYNTNITFEDSQDQNMWKMDRTTTSFVRSAINTDTNYETALEKLNKLIGLRAVKEQVNSILNTIQMSQKSGDRNFEFSHHMIFAGNAGTGKTTVANIVAQALFEVGAIPENKCTHATVDTLIKGYVGQTAANVREILDNALGGVLFIDEAYQLTVKAGEKTFNDEALSVLIRYMEEHRGDLVVIAAGYSKEMREFLASNVGLTRRFQWIEFEDYTSHEMAEIFELIRSEYDDQYDKPDLSRIIESLFAKLIEVNLSIPDANGRIQNGGNGGLVRNVYQRITFAKNNRIANYGGNHTLTKEDIVEGFNAEIKNAYARRI